MKRVFQCVGLLLIGLAVRPAALAAQAPAVVTVLAGKVTKVIDGDTLDVLLSSGKIRVRLHGIDAPERDQAGGAAATTWLAQQLLNQPVQLEPVSQDQYDRMVAVVHREGRNINREVVQTGHGWAYRQYMRRSDDELCRVEERARLERAGLWATTARAPWEFRATKGNGPFTDFTGTTARDCSNAIGRKAH